MLLLLLLAREGRLWGKAITYRGVRICGAGSEGMAQAYRSGHYTLKQVGAHFGVSYATVSRAVKQMENRD